jgi:Uma2 family endonuclease
MKTLDDLETSLEWYFEMHPEERDMGESFRHMRIGDYLRQVLLWYFRAEKHVILKNQIVFTDRTHTTSPDIAVIKNVNLSEAEVDDLVSWRIDPPRRPAPSVVIEISSSGNWDKDIELDKLPERYAEFGVKEYFAYDPKGYWEDEEVSLKGWRNENGQMEALELEDGRIWSVELNCYVVDNDGGLIFEDANGNRLLTEAEAKDLETLEARQRANAEAIARFAEYERAEAERQRANAEAQAREQERQRVEAESQAKELEKQRAEAEYLRAEVERQRTEAEAQARELERQRAEAEKFAAKLRELEIDPDTL